MLKHELKYETTYFGSVLAGFKTFDIRFNDRNYKVGDILVLKEFDSFKEQFTGREIKKKITYITNYAQQDGYVVMSIVDQIIDDGTYDEPSQGYSIIKD